MPSTAIFFISVAILIASTASFGYLNYLSDGPPSFFGYRHKSVIDYLFEWFADEMISQLQFSTVIPLLWFATATCSMYSCYVLLCLSSALFSAGLRNL